jgi:hypothetical protein
VSAGNFINAYVDGVTKLTFEWEITQRKAAARFIPIGLDALRMKAPISPTKPDSGRFKKSIGYRVDTSAGALKISFVSTAPYAKYVLRPTQGGRLITPVNTLALRFTSGNGNYVFAQSVVRGSTKGNDFNKRVAIAMRPIVKEIFKDSITVIGT